MNQDNVCYPLAKGSYSDCNSRSILRSPRAVARLKVLLKLTVAVASSDVEGSSGGKFWEGMDPFF